LHDYIPILFSDDVFTGARAGQPVTHDRPIAIDQKGETFIYSRIYTSDRIRKT